MRRRAGVLALVVVAGALAGCTPTKSVSNAGVLRRADGEMVLLVVPCRDHRVTDVILNESADVGRAPDTDGPWADWWIEAPPDPARPTRRGRLNERAEVVPFQVPPGCSVQDDELEHRLSPDVWYSVGGFMRGKYRHHATGPHFKLADLDRVDTGEVLAESPRDNGKRVVMTLATFEDRAADRC